jgi:PAS domain S-box-containing protein
LNSIKKIKLNNKQMKIQKKDKVIKVMNGVSATNGSVAQKQSSEYARSLIEASLDPLITINIEGKITDMNQALSNITGIEREKLIGSNFFDYFTEPQKAREVYQKVFAKGSVTDSPLTLRRKDNKLTDVLFNGSVYKDDRGNVLGVVIVARDVTAQKLLSKYSLSLIEASLDPLVTISTEGKITDMNEALADITGMTRKQLTGTDFFDYFTEPQKAREVYQEVFAKGSVADSPLTLRHKDGKLTDVLFNGSVYKDDRGNVLGAVVVARDIAEQKWATELRIANKELAFQNDEKEKRAAELVIANKELAFQNEVKEKRAAELIIANEELVFQTGEKEKRAAELVIADKELDFQNAEKGKRAAELIIANKELAFQNDEKEKRANELRIANYARSLIEASLDPLVTISPEGKITDMNEATVNITGIDREKLIGSDFFDYFTEPQKSREVYQEVFAKGSVVDAPLTLRHKDGKLTDVLFNGSVYKDDRGNVLGVVIVARDITAQKQLAEREIAGREKELMRIEELERFRKLTVGRELKMIELKKEIEELKSKN